MATLLRTLQRKFGISAPRVAVRTALPWYWRWLGLVALGAIIAGVAWATYDYGMVLAGYRQSEAERSLARLSNVIEEQKIEIADLRTRAAEAEQQLKIERATYGELAKQVKTLANENASLKEDLIFFQSLMPAGGRDGGITVNRFKLEKEALPGEYRYRLMLVQGGQRVKEFHGTLQFVLNVEQAGKQLVLVLPADMQKPSKEFSLSFKFFQRIEGTFQIAPDAVVKGMQVRVFENGSGTPKLTQSVSIS